MVPRTEAFCGVFDGRLRYLLHGTPFADRYTTLAMEQILIASISGVRGIFGRGLDPEVIVRYTASFGMWCTGRGDTVVVGRDARVSGEICSSFVIDTLRSQGFRVIDVGLATTPTVELAVIAERAAGGVILSASHNPAE